MATLEVKDIHTYYGQSHILRGVSATVEADHLVAILGRNGAGKTTIIRSIMGLTPPKKGSIKFNNQELVGSAPHTIFQMGIKLIPQGRGIFPMLTVKENLKLAVLKADRSSMKEELAKVYSLYPILKKREKQKGAHLSGGERQMLAIARSLLGKPKLLLMDEPSEGLAPILVKKLGNTILEIKERGLIILLTEQNVKLALNTADRFYILDKGEVVFEGTSNELQENPQVLRSYLGIS